MTIKVETTDVNNGKLEFKLDNLSVMTVTKVVQEFDFKNQDDRVAFLKLTEQLALLMVRYGYKKICFDDVS